MKQLSLLLLLLLLLTSCSTTPQYTPLPPPNINLKQKLLSIKPQARPITLIDGIPITNNVVPLLQTNILHFIYPAGASNKLWSFQFSTNLKDWNDTTNYFGYNNGDIGVFKSNNIPQIFYRVRLY